ncbi:MAG: elongation factor P [Acidobacteria bacterium]|nr:elongation factor P [Acidobacteriota bacterium]
MVVASQLRGGSAIRVASDLFKVVSAEYHAGGGKMGGVTHCKLQNLRTGAYWEHRFRPDERLEDIALERRGMDFLYSDEDNCYFMDPQNYEQFPIPKVMVGKAEQFLKPEMRIQVEFYEGQPVSIAFPPVVEIKVDSTAAPVHQQQDNTYKAATLENGLEIMVPQFIATGDRIRVEVETGKYVERVQGRKK